jgi:hypothetical protein
MRIRKARRARCEVSGSYDYRRARDWVFGMIREDERVVAYKPGPANIQERALLLALVEFAPNIEPSTTALAMMLGTSERQVRRLLRTSEQKGLLRVEQRPGQRSRYVLTTLDPGLIVRPDASSPLTNSPPTPDGQSSPPRTNRPPKQTSKADKEADKRERAARRSRKCPADFVANETDRAEEAIAASAGVKVDTERRRFLDHEHARAKSDWHGAWRNWLRKAVEFLPTGGGKPRSAPQETPAGATFDDDAERRTEALIQRGTAKGQVVQLSLAGGAK